MSSRCPAWKSRTVAGDGVATDVRVADTAGRATADVRIADVAAVALAAFLALAATLVGVRTGWHPADADEIVYRETLTLMRHGESFYRAQAAALIAKEHRPPTSIRA